MSEDIEEVVDDTAMVTSPVQRHPPPRRGWTVDEDTTEVKDMATPLKGQTKFKKLRIPDSKQLFATAVEASSGDRSPAYSEPASQSPSTLMSPTLEGSKLEHSKSFDSTSVSSKGSKRTSISAEMSSVIRQRVRQQAKSIVEKKRGSVQLAKRLLRSQTLQGEKDQAVLSVDDYKATDEIIEKTLKMGAKFARGEKSVLPPEHVQRQFFEPVAAEEADEMTELRKGPLTVYTKPKSTEKYSKQFGEVLTIFKPMNRDTLEDPVSRLGPRSFQSRSARDFRLVLARHGDKFADGQFGVLGLGPVMTSKVERSQRGEDEDFDLVTFGAPVLWDEWIRHGMQPTKYYQLNIDLHHVEFDHHWLFGAEDVLARRLRALHSDYVAITERLVQAWRALNAVRRRFDGEILTDEEKQELTAKMAALMEDIQTLRNDAPKLTNLMDRAYEELQDFWSRTGLNTTHYKLLKLEPDEDDSQMKALELPIYTLQHLHAKEDATRPSTAISRVLPRTHSPREQAKKLDADRRAALPKCKIRLELYFNDILVSKTDPITLEWDFTATFRRIYVLKVHEPPENVKLVVAEKFGGNAWRTLASVYIPFVWVQEEEDVKLEPMEFASELEVGSFKNSLGCGDPPKSPFIQGRVYCNAVWMEAETPWTFHKMADKSQPSEQAKFHIIPPETQLVSPAKEDVRLEALRRRFQTRRFGLGFGLQSRAANQRVGLLDHEVEAFSFLADEWKPDDSTPALGSMSEPSLDVIHELGEQYAVSLRQSLLESSALHHRTKAYQDVVREEPIPALFDFFGDLLRPPDISRKLKPMRNQRSATSAAHARYRLVVNVQSALNLPEKANGEPTSVFVDVCFKKVHAQTAAVEGSFANWQETLMLEVERENEMEFEMANVHEMVELRLYDRRRTPLGHDDRERNTVHEQLEHKWLGQVVLPFAAVFAMGKLDGVVNVRRPLVHTDYKFAERCSQLKVLITIDPPLLPPKLVLNEVFLPGESNEAIQECYRWEQKCRLKYPNRVYRCVASDTNGKSVILTRYIQTMSPPPQLRNISVSSPEISLKMVQMAAHIVSCVPFNYHPVMHAHMCDIWMTVDQMMTIGCGSVEEHAVLLCNWLLGMGYTAALVLGTALPNGVNSAYVYVEVDSYPSFLINPTDATRFFVTDTHCPLSCVSAVVTANNIYGNIQQSGQPAQLDFNFNRRSLWEPLFPPNRPQLSSVQKDSVVYTDVTEDVVMELKGSLEREIRLHFDRSRPYGIPQWNVLASRALREILAELSENFTGHVEVADKFRALGLNYDTSAVAFQRGYHTKQELIDDVLGSQINVNANPLTQFAFAVNVQPLFNNIASVSVAVASLSNPT